MDKIENPELYLICIFEEAEFIFLWPAYLPTPDIIKNKERK